MKPIFAVLFFCCVFTEISAQSSLIADGAKLTKGAGEYAFTEGPARDAKGNVYFTDQPNDKIYRWSAQDGSITVFMDKTGRANGMYFDKKGNLYACTDENFELRKIDKNKNVEVLVTEFEGKKLNGPNDLWIAPNGGIYFTDPYYQRNYWTRTKAEMDEKRVYYLSPDRKTMSIAARDFIAPNGIIGSSDGTKLYIADIGGRKTYSFKVNADGSLTDRKLFTEMGSDGMTIDQMGNVYLTGRGVTIFDKNGKQIEQIPVPEGWTANVTFGGKKRKTLFITASKSVYTIEMKVKGD